MTKPQKNSDTLDQLRGYMRRHTEAQTDAPPHLANAPVAIPGTAAAAIPSEQTPMVKPIVHPRFTVHLTASELASLGEIVLKTHQSTGFRITATDVLRVGLKRVGEASISTAEIAAVRASDARRNRIRPQRATAQ